MPSKLPTLPRPGKPKTLKSPVVKHARSPIKKSAPANSHVEAHEYNPKSGHLTVTFSGGRKYRYTGVSEKTASGLGDTTSVGRYLHREIIGKHPHEKM